MLQAIKSISAYFNRMWLVWMRHITPSLSSNIGGPLIFLFAFGFGLGSVVKTMDGFPYLIFVLPGMLAQAIMFTSSFETTIEAYFRLNIQRTWDSVLATPVTFKELLAAEILWGATKAFLSCLGVLVVGYFASAIGSVSGALLALLVYALGAICFASCGLVFTSYAKSADFFSYFFTFWLTPMFMFCGVLFPMDRFPEWVQLIAWLLPMSHLMAVVRPLTAGVEITFMQALPHLVYLVLLTLVAYTLAHNKFKKRMFD